MIVRIMGEGQVRLADSHLARLNEFDDALSAAVERGDEASFRLTLHALLDAVHEQGEPLPDDALEPSELILPARGSTIDDVRAMLSQSEEGLFPG
ncbi:F0F1 ATP synthase [Wenjunlia vitaminophila]|uniref:F0F1 ATP synthase n=1 Tax=Wenjunlia vitaminophila TaxID=76728 RepID=A0A0T6LV86_WENVI|nr:hypothetical protein [Wenjunlia vitaminophila]KRV49912.1 F0F1 ATP synthase [Wenjunlia vitaminophila]